MRSPLALALFAAVLSACPAKKPLPVPQPSERCEVDLAATGLFSAVGNGAKAKLIEAEAELVGGPFAQGVVGDYLLENDKIRVVIQRPYRHIGAAPYGGAIIDADLKRAAGQAPRDQIGKLTVLYAFGRTINAKKVEVLQDGSTGGAAVIAATGVDAVNDYINVPNIIDQYLGAGVKLVTDPNLPLPITATTYFVLSPGESRVRVLTAFCNSGKENIVTGVGDLFEQGGVSDFFNPGSCKNGLGAKGCTADASPWYGYQAEEVAYAVRSYKFADPKTPEPSSALLYVSGVVGLLAGGEGQTGLLTWIDAQATRRPGSFGILAGSQRSYLRDLFVGRDLGDALSQMQTFDATSRARLDVTVTRLDDDLPGAAVRVAVIDSSAKQKTVLVTDSLGKAKVDLPPGNYTVVAGERGHAVEAPTAVTVPSTGQVSAALKLGRSRTLSVSVKDPFGAALTSKVTVRCPSGPCPTQLAHYRPFFDVDEVPSNIAAIGFVPATGSLELRVPPGAYEVFVTRGPEYSAFPDTFPMAGQPVDLTTTAATVNATLARVVDTRDWMSADLHVHAVASADSSVANAARVASFAAEGVDVLVSTDHDFITDFDPVIRSLGAQDQMASMIGCEVTPFDYGHQQAYPVTRGDGPPGGALDWAGGDGASLRLDQLYAGLKSAFPNVVVQMNHPRGSGGSLTRLKVDTGTGATHEKAETFRMEPNPAATALDTKLLSNAFDAIEVQNGIAPNLSVMNDWMTFLSRGLVKTSTGVSDTHDQLTNTGGYGRTWVRLGVDEPGKFDPAAFATAMKAQRAIASSGPFITLTAQKVAAGTPTGPLAQIGDTLSVDPTAGDTVELTVVVQAPEWMNFTAVEIYTHTSGREAIDGVANATWPDNRRLAFKTYDPTMLPLTAVPGLNGFAARKIEVTEKFTVTPTADTWYVAMVRGGTASRSLVPMAWHGVSCSAGVCTANDTRPTGFTNAVLIDADKSGKYDDFPIKQQLLRLPPAAPPAPARRTPTLEELDRAIRAMLSHE